MSKVIVLIITILAIPNSLTAQSIKIFEFSEDLKILRKKAK